MKIMWNTLPEINKRIDFKFTFVTIINVATLDEKMKNQKLGKKQILTQQNQKNLGGLL